MEIKLTKDNFDALVLLSDKPVLVDFWAPWCMPCRMLAPTVEEVAAETEGKAIIGKVNVDEENELAMRYGIHSIPTLLLFVDGKETQRIVGVQNKQTLLNLLQA